MYTHKIHNKNFHTAAKPEIRQDMILVEQRRFYAIATYILYACVLSLTWNSPVNYNLEYLSGYMVNIDGENIVNKTDNLNTTLNSFPLPLDCGSHSVSLQAFDICNRVSNSTPVVTVTPEEFPFSLITPDPGPTAGTGGAPECSGSTIRGMVCILYSILITNLLLSFNCYPDTLLSIILGLLLVVVVVFGIVIAVLANALWRSKDKRTFKYNQVRDGLS